VSTLLDTNVLSELLRAGPDQAVQAWVAAQPADSLCVSAVTQAEMLLGAKLLPAGKRRDGLERALAAMFEEDFGERILPFDSAACASNAGRSTWRQRSAPAASATMARAADSGDSQQARPCRSQVDSLARE
jgi:predicted nucleic acid-binding protein